MRGHKVVGIITRANLMRALASIHRGTPKTSRNDAVIRNRILSALKKQPWSAEIQVDVLVRNGVVDLWVLPMLGIVTLSRRWSAQWGTSSELTTVSFRHVS